MGQQRIKNIFLLLFGLCCLGVSLQTSAQYYYPVDSLTTKFDLYRKSVLQEKIFVHTDRSSYLTGETIWFKLYLTDASFHKPLGMSDVAYVEILDQDNEPVLQSKLALVEGKGQGSLFIPASLTSGNFILRAYTTWMKNFDTDFFFHKTITIVNPFKALEKSTTKTNESVHADFFPEGGSLVTGLQSKIAFRFSRAGRGIMAKGFLLNSHNDTLVSFQPLKFGLGQFTFTPGPDRYRVVVRDGNKYSTYNLPSIQETGYVMTVVDSAKNRISVRVTSKGLAGPNASVIYVFAHARQIIGHAEMKPFQQQVTVDIPKENLADGISHITVFDAAFNPICERLYFKKPTHTLNIALKSDQDTYANRRHVKIALQTSRAADISLAVFKMDSLPVHASTIDAYLWLTSDLKGQIENPEYYLAAQDNIVKEATDNLMLTHGWRRFTWSTILQKKEPLIQFVPEYRGHMISGMVYKPDGTPAQGIMTYLASPGKITRLYGSLSNMKGEIFFEMQKFTGASSIILQTNPQRDSIYRIEMKSPFSSKTSAIAPPPFSISPNTAATLLDRTVALQVQDIYYREQQDRMAPLVLDSAAFYGKPDERYLLDAYNRFPVMEEVMREYVPGVIVRKRKDGFHFLVVNDVNRSIFNETPLILLDGVPLFDADEIMNFSPLKVKKLEVVTKRYFLGPLTVPGIVSYTTYTGDLAGFTLNPKAITLSYEGLQRQREFYSPQYEGQSKTSRMPDQRTALYWNPQIKTGSDGRQEISFYTSDQSGVFKVIAQGLTDDGAAGSSQVQFIVSEPNH